MAAVGKLTEEAVLADIAKSNSDPDVRGAAVRKVTNEVLLADRAENDSDSHVRKAAAERLRALRV